MEFPQISVIECLSGSENSLPSWVKQERLCSKIVDSSSTLKKRKKWDLEAVKLDLSSFKPRSTHPSSPREKTENSCSLPASTTSSPSHVHHNHTQSFDSILNPSGLISFKEFLPRPKTKPKTVQIIKTPTNESENLMHFKITDYHELKTVISEKEKKYRKLKEMVREKEDEISILRKMERKYDVSSSNKQLFRECTFIINKEKENDTMHEKFGLSPSSITREDRAEVKHLLRMKQPLSARLNSPIMRRDTHRRIGRLRRSRSIS